jgi:hypothetical protein
VDVGIDDQVTDALIDLPNANLWSEWLARATALDEFTDPE